ncbi:hypothetical protein VSS74_13825, partial [Conexibacter stalactiti]
GGGGWTGGGGGGAGASRGTDYGAGGGGGAGGQNFLATAATATSESLATALTDGVAIVTYEPLAAPVVTTQPTLSGVVAVGRQLTCEPGAWSATPALAYAWLRGGRAITSASSARYTVQREDVGEQLACQVTATNAAGSAIARTPAVLVPAATTATLANTVVPVVTGTATVGGRLTCNPGAWAAATTPSFTYAWLRNGIAIAGKTASSYAPVQADAGQVLQCTVRASAGGASATAQSFAVGGPARLVVLNTTLLVSRRGAVTIPLGCFGPTACRIGAISVSGGGQTLARAAARTIRAGATAKVALTLAKRGRSRLARAGAALTVRIVATPAGGYGGNVRAQFVALRGTNG